MKKSMKRYDPKKIEKKWQAVWDKKKLNEAQSNSRKKKYYVLVEFPYPSGEGLHTGHIRSYTALDVVARKRRAEGYNVLYPMGWDAFGLPTENYAIKTGVHPRIVTKKNTDNFRRQLKSLGFSFDWSREINTTDPAYYTWTQWIFLKLFEKGLAYKAKRPINWCPKDKIGLADEEVIDGKCERCGSLVEKREKEQWMLAITKYADRLHDDLNSVNFLEKIKTQQRNWIGRSEGAEIEFKIQDSKFKIPVFTTRVDTIFGATFLVVAPEHEFVQQSRALIKNWNEVGKYIESAKKKDEIERTAEGKEKTGIKLEGVSAINPATQKEIPIFVADYVLGHYGTGAIMAVPAHDERDFAFAKQFKLEVVPVIAYHVVNAHNPPREGKPNSERNVVHAILRDTKKKTALVAFLKDGSWGDRKPVNFVIGGVEDGEDWQKAAEREIREETGYSDFKFSEEVMLPVEAHFFQAQKDVNRKAHIRTFVFDLVSDKKETVADEENTKHEFRWIPYEEVMGRLNIPTDQIVWKYLQEGGFPHAGSGVLVNSGEFSGLSGDDAKARIIKKLGGRVKTTFKLRDWVFSRQRYWGEPIPIIHCEKCGTVPVPEKDLPVELPNVKSYTPTDSGESPLAAISSWVDVKCPQCKGKAKRETDVMPNWAGSSWYYLRYTDPKNKKVFANKTPLKYFLPVDWYNGGMEHTTLHLLYSRFWHKFLYDLKFVPGKEPYQKRTSHGLILAGDGTKMSKSKGNVVNPDSIVKLLGADTLRHYEMFMGPFDQAIAWNTDAVAGSRRFLERVWKISEKVEKTAKTKIKFNSKFESLFHQTIKKVGDDIEELKMNTALSQMMILLNALEKEEKIPRSYYETYLRLLAPFTPHVAEEIWQSLGEKSSIHLEPWPKFDKKKLLADAVKVPVQINGKVKATVSIARGLSEDEAKGTALAHPDILKLIIGKQVKRIIYVPERIINIVL